MKFWELMDSDYLYIVYPKCLKILEITTHEGGKNFYLGVNEEEEEPEEMDVAQDEEEPAENKYLPAGNIILDVDFTSRESVVTGLTNLIGARKGRWQGQDYSQVISRLAKFLNNYAQNGETLSKEI